MTTTTILLLIPLAATLAVWKLFFPWLHGRKAKKKVISHYGNSTYDYVHITPKDKEVHVTLIYSGYYDPGVTSGPVDSCYPAEGELDILAVETEKGKVLDFDAWVKKMKISPKEVAAIEECLMEAIRDRSYDEYEP